jgi:hypothetical protein
MRPLDMLFGTLQRSEPFQKETEPNGRLARPLAFVWGLSMGALRASAAAQLARLRGLSGRR